MPTSSTPLIRVDNLFKTYRLGRVDVPVLNGVSVEIARGEFVAILGASGSGKSTLMHLMGGLDRPDGPGRFNICRRCGQNLAGVQANVCPECGNARLPAAKESSTITFDNQPLDITKASEIDAFRRSRVGFVFQFYHLLPELNITENVLLGAMVANGRVAYLSKRSELRERAEGLLKRVGIGHRLTHRPNELSGGERQRAAIARALINNPPLLLADEPTGNLDRKTGATILDLFTSLHNEGQTIVVVTHDEATAARADRVLHLADGRLVTADAVSSPAAG